MTEFDLLAQELLEKAANDEKNQQERDKQLIDRVLEIYDQKYVAELLRKIGKNEWSRETLNRWVNGKSKPKTLTQAEVELLRKMLPEPPAHHPNYAFRFIDLFAGIGGIRRGLRQLEVNVYLPVSGIRRLFALIRQTGITTKVAIHLIMIYARSR